MLDVVRFLATILGIGWIAALSFTFIAAVNALRQTDEPLVIRQARESVEMAG